MPADSAHLEQIFGEALAQPDAAARGAYLDKACGGDLELLHRVEALLAAHNATDNLLILPDSNGEQATILYPTLSEGPGTRIGRYKLLEQIGEGGFGVVFMAEQEEPVRRRVALKIIKLGMDTKQVVARFEAERQALAMMDHPNIAKVLDAGATDTGRPYFVMELVRGIPITQFCDQNKLNTIDRLKLFIAVCSAVQHAHQKGIIHRDLKPSNVLVTMHDDRPVPKIIDFGIAKATQARLTERTLFTEFRQMIGTPAYMSPEQAQMSGIDIDTRSDIYSLGVLLYELLTGTTPFASKDLLSAGYAEMQRMIREVEPPPPSTRLSTFDAESRTARASERGSDPKHLSELLRGDLDWIVMRCLEKDRTRRYDTPNSLARDIQHYLADEPVEARRPTRAYRLKKFVRRNKVGVFAGTAVICALVVGFALALIGLLHARAQTIVTRRETAKKDIGWALMENVQGKGNSEMAEFLAREGLAIAEELYDSDSREVLDSRHVLSLVLAKRKPDEAIALERETIERRRRLGFPENDPQLSFMLDNLANILTRQGQLAEAESLYREALPLWRKRDGNDDPHVTNTLDHLADLLGRAGNYAEAEAFAQECYATRRRTLGEQHASTVKALNTLIELLSKQNKMDEANQLRPTTRKD